MRLRIAHIIVFASLLLPLYGEAADLRCGDVNPQICSFLQRYLQELKNWNEPGVSVTRKMHDDKFVILDGSIANTRLIDERTSFTLTRYDDKGYEACWQTGEQTLLRVAFPIQFELILGKTQKEIEQELQADILAAPEREDPNLGQMDSIAPNVFRSSPVKVYYLADLNDAIYRQREPDGTLTLINDSLQLDYTIANLFQTGLNKRYTLQVRQDVYGFYQHLDYSIPLQQWLNYCKENRITCYVAIEGESTSEIMVLVIAQNTDLGYNHVLSAMVPRAVLSKEEGVIPVKISAFIPMHNVKYLYEERKK